MNEASTIAEDAFNFKCEQVTIEKYRRLQQGGVITESMDLTAPSAYYDLIRNDEGQLCRCEMGTFPEPLLRGPLPMDYWAAPFYRPRVAPSTRLAVFAAFVDDLKNLSKCEDRHTAAIITDKDLGQIYSIGVNGGPRGSAHQCLCKLPGKYTCIHAEANAIAKCNSADKDKVMICSLSPCVTCASLIVNSGFSTVYYLEAWKDPTGIEILKEAGIETGLIRRP